MIKKAGGVTGRYVVESVDGKRISTIQVKTAPGEWGFLPEHFTFSPRGDWVIVVGRGSVTTRGRYQDEAAKSSAAQASKDDSDEAEFISLTGKGALFLTEIFDTRTGRLVYGPLEGALGAVSEDGRFAKLNDLSVRSTDYINTIGLKPSSSDKVVPLRMVEGSAPAWFLDFIDAIVGCRIDSSEPVDLPPKALQQLLQEHVPHGVSPADKVFLDYLRTRFGRE